MAINFLRSILLIIFGAAFSVASHATPWRSLAQTDLNNVEMQAIENEMSTIDVNTASEKQSTSSPENTDFVQPLTLDEVKEVHETQNKSSIEESAVVGKIDSFSGDGKVDAIYLPDPLSTFRERRPFGSFVFSLGLEQYYPENYISKIDDSSYEELFGSSTLDFLKITAGYKVNNSLFGLETGGTIGTAKINDGRVSLLTQTDTDATLDITKYELYLSVILDNLFEEPYVAPYFKGFAYQMEWLEYAKTGEEKSGRSDVGFGFNLGGLIQMNWLDSKAAFNARNSFNLNNAFVDLFVSFYQSTNDDGPDFSSNTNFGAGLKLEF